MRLGFITELLSKPIRYIFSKGIALPVLVSHLPTLLGFEGEARSGSTASRFFADETKEASYRIGFCKRCPISWKSCRVFLTVNSPT
jgi:MFS superfamily sulfate permease-like transporter